jgi:hypothetical protein
VGGWQARCRSLASERAVRALRGMTTREGGSVSGDGPIWGTRLAEAERARTMARLRTEIVLRAVAERCECSEGPDDLPETRKVYLAAVLQAALKRGAAVPIFANGLMIVSPASVGDRAVVGHTMLKLIGRGIPT